jgi:hypothetical protein
MFSLISLIGLDILPGKICSDIMYSCSNAQSVYNEQNSKKSSIIFTG